VEGGYHGHDGLRKFWADNAENFELFRVEFSELRDLGDRVLAVGTIRIRGKSGVETDIPTAGIATFRDGKLTRWEDFRDRRRALEAVGLSE
jgi:ketosteroid isomerase-like protein